MCVASVPRNTVSLPDVATIATQRGLRRPFDVLLLMRQTGYVSLFQILHEEMIPVPWALLMNVERFQSHFCACALREMEREGNCNPTAMMLFHGSRQTEIPDLPKPATPKRTAHIVAWMGGSSPKYGCPYSYEMHCSIYGGNFYLVWIGIGMLWS